MLSPKETVSFPVPFAHRAALQRPLLMVAVQAGFPSPAEDYVDSALDLNERLVRNPASTYFVRVSGNSMEPAIPNGALLVVDCSLPPTSGKVVVVVLDGEMTVKRFRRTGLRISLHAENPNYQPIEVGSGQDFEVFGVVVAVVNERP